MVLNSLSFCLYVNLLISPPYLNEILDGYNNLDCRCSQVLDLSLLPLASSLILTVASRLLHPYSTSDKTSRLMVKRFSTVGDMQRGSQSYLEKRRGRREIEVSRRRREVSKGERQI